MTLAFSHVVTALKQIELLTTTPEGLVELNSPGTGICRAAEQAFKTLPNSEAYELAHTAWETHYPTMLFMWPEYSGRPRYPVFVSAFADPLHPELLCESPAGQFDSNIAMFGGSPYGMARIRLLTFLREQFEIMASVIAEHPEVSTYEQALYHAQGPRSAPPETPAGPRQFGSSGSAYDSCQCDDSISNGDICHVESEKAIILAWTWPLLVAGDAESKANQAHTVNDEPAAIKDVLSDAGITWEQFSAARTLAIQLGYQLQPWAITWAAWVPQYGDWKSAQESK